MKYFVLLFIFLFLACSNSSYEDLIETDITLNLKWNKAYPDDTIDKSIVGLLWSLSYLGATLPDFYSNIVIDNLIIQIDIDKLGFTENAKQKLIHLHDNILQSKEYEITNAIDLGRYITLLIGASEHYYEIVGVPEELSTLLNTYTLKLEKGYVDNSGVSLKHRIINFSEQNGFNQFFISSEIDPITQDILEYETIEILPNGQLRFGVFDENGFRINSAAQADSNAGKPAKCMWCHESTIQPLFTPQNDFTGYLTYLELKDTLLNYRVSHNTIKNTLIDGVDFSQTQQHTITELLYISFMETSAERLSLEWGLSLIQVQERLSGISTHIHPEFPFLGELYYRNEIESLAPFEGLQTSTFVREPSPTEVNHIN